MLAGFDDDAEGEAGESDGDGKREDEASDPEGPIHRAQVILSSPDA